MCWTSSMSSSHGQHVAMLISTWSILNHTSSNCHASVRQLKRCICNLLWNEYTVLWFLYFQNIETGTLAALIRLYLPANSEVRLMSLIKLFALTSNAFKISVLPLQMTYTFMWMNETDWVFPCGSLMSWGDFWNKLF